MLTSRLSSCGAALAVAASLLASCPESHPGAPYTCCLVEVGCAPSDGRALDAPPACDQLTAPCPPEVGGGGAYTERCP